jgi:hypothetical protein
MAKDLAYEAELAELLELVGDVANSHDRTVRDALNDLSERLDTRQAGEESQG